MTQDIRPMPSVDQNPYAAPAAEPDAPGHAPRTTFAGEPRPWEVVEVLELSWSRARTQKLVAAFATFCAFVLPQLVTHVPGMVFELDAHGIPVGSVPVYVAALVTAQIASFALSCYFAAGSVNVWIKIARGQSAGFGDVFNAFTRTPTMVAAMLLVTIAMVAGFVCLIIPGFIVSVALSLTPFFVVDVEMGPIRAIVASWRVTRGHRLAMVGLGFASVVILFLGVLFCGLGLLLAYPIVSVASAIVYLRISGRAINEEELAQVAISAPAVG